MRIENIFRWKEISPLAGYYNLICYTRELVIIDADKLTYIYITKFIVSSTALNYLFIRVCLFCLPLLLAESHLNVYVEATPMAHRLASDDRRNGSMRAIYHVI